MGGGRSSGLVKVEGARGPPAPGAERAAWRGVGRWTNGLGLPEKASKAREPFEGARGSDRSSRVPGSETATRTASKSDFFLGDRWTDARVMPGSRSRTSREPARPDSKLVEAHNNWGRPSGAYLALASPLLLTTQAALLGLAALHTRRCSLAPQGVRLCELPLGANSTAPWTNLTGERAPEVARTSAAPICSNPAPPRPPSLSPGAPSTCSRLSSRSACQCASSQLFLSFA